MKMGKKKFQIFSIIAVYILFCMMNCFNVNSQSLKRFEESCDGDCDEREGLSCSSETKKCECMNPNATIYDTARSQCVTKAGHPCRRIGTENLCVPHASCAFTNSLCECEKNYFQTKNASCAPVANYGESCSSKKLCDKLSGIECVGGSKSKQYQCQCKYPRDQYYDSDEKKCISYVGGNCSFGLACVKNAVCSQDIFEVRRGETPNGKSYFYNATVGKRCACLPGFRITKNRECYATYKSPCNYIENNCNFEEHLNCFDNRICLCQNPLHQIYSEEDHKCLNLVNSNCDTTADTTTDCVPNAKCIQGVYKCNIGYSTTSNRRCLKDFGESCQTPKSEDSDCNLSKNLSCQNGTCSCIDDTLEYNPNEQICQGVENSPCGRLVLYNGNGHSSHASSSSLELENGNGGNGNLYKSSTDTTSVIIHCKQGLKCKNVNGYPQCM